MKRFLIAAFLGMSALLPEALASAGEMTALLGMVSANASGKIEPFFLRAPKYVDVRVLAGGVAETYTIPSGATHLVFSADGAFYLRADGNAASVPVADVSDGTGSFLSPAQLDVRRFQTLSFISSSARVVTISAYSD